jgi:hypothetical protein
VALIYSRWQPDGGYDYYEVESQMVPIGNDLPTPKLVPVGNLGVPSIEAGRQIPARAKYVGSGDKALGVVAPTDLSRLGQALQDEDPQVAKVLWFMGGLAAAGLVWLVARRYA